MAKKTNKEDYENNDTNDIVDEDLQKGKEKANDVKDKTKETVTKIKDAPEKFEKKMKNAERKITNVSNKMEKVSDAIDPNNIGNTIKNAKNAVSDKINHAKDTLKSAPKKVKQNYHAIKKQVGDAVNKAKKTVDYARKNPAKSAGKVGKNAANLAKKKGKNFLNNINPITKVKRKVDNIKNGVKAARRALRTAGKLAKNAVKLIKNAGKAIAKIGSKIITFLVTNPVGWICDIIIVVILLFCLIFYVAKKSDKNADGTNVGYVGYSSITVSEEEKFFMYALCIHERGGGTIDQMSYVASVVMNRALTGRYGNSVRDVIFAANQFQGVTQLQYSGGHYMSGTGSDWQNQCQAVENYLVNNNTGSLGYSDEQVKNAIEATNKVLSGGDTTSTSNAPYGATYFATPYYALSWINSSSLYIAMFNDEDGKDAGTNGTHYNSGEEWGSHSFLTTKADQDALAQYAQVSAGNGELGKSSGEGTYGTYKRGNKTYKLYYQNYLRDTTGSDWGTGVTGLCFATCFAIAESGNGDIRNPKEIRRDTKKDYQGVLGYCGLFKYNFNMAMNQLANNNPVIFFGDLKNNFNCSSKHAIIALDINKKDGKILIVNSYYTSWGDNSILNRNLNISETSNSNIGWYDLSIFKSFIERNGIGITFKDK